MNPNYILAKEKAEEIIIQNYISEPPIDIINIAINEGLTVLEAAFEDTEEGVISGYLDVSKKAIYINAEDNYNRKKFTIAHELGHWLLHRDKIGNELDDYAILYRKSLGKLNENYLEKEANYFAANLLVPIDFLEKYMSEGLSVKELAKVFSVSEDVIGFRKKYIQNVAI